MDVVIGADVFGSVLDNEFVMFENWVVDNEGSVDNDVIVFMGVVVVFVGVAVVDTLAVLVVGAKYETIVIFQTFFCECL